MGPPRNLAATCGGQLLMPTPATLHNSGIQTAWGGFISGKKKWTTELFKHTGGSTASFIFSNWCVHLLYLCKEISLQSAKIH